MSLLRLVRTGPDDGFIHGLAVSLSGAHEPVSLDRWRRTSLGLPRAEAPFRNFLFRREVAGPGTGSLEYRIADNRVLAAHPDLFVPDDGADSPHAIWYAYRGDVFPWIVEETEVVLTEEGKASGWVRASGRGAKILLADRVLWPTAFDENHLDQSQWASQTYHVEDTAVGPMLWAMVNASNARFPEAVRFVEGTIETDPEGGDIWTVDYRFRYMSELVDEVEKSLGRVVISGRLSDGKLVFDYRRALGVEEASQTLVIKLEEGIDLEVATLRRSARESASWVVVEGGQPSGGLPPLAIAEDATVARRKERYLRDESSLTSAQAGASATAELGARSATKELEIGFVEARYRAMIDFREGSWIRIAAPTAGIDETAQVAAVTIGENEETKAPTVAIELGDVGTRPDERAADIAISTSQGLSTASALAKSQHITNAGASAGDPVAQIKQAADAFYRAFLGLDADGNGTLAFGPGNVAPTLAGATGKSLLAAATAAAARALLGLADPQIALLTGSDVTMTLANTWYTAVHLDLTAGTWLLIARAQVHITASNYIYFRIHDGSAACASDQDRREVASWWALSLFGLVTLAAPATLTFDCAGQTTNGVIHKAMASNGQGDNATGLVAIRVL